MADGTSKSELRKTWESAAPGWAKWEQVFSAGLSEATDALLDMAGIESGMRILDLACGAGDQTMRAAERVGPSGSVVASDISPTMLEHVRRSAASSGLHNIETVESAAEDLDAAMGPFDGAISRLGLMLFSSPPAALAAVRRVLNPGARFAALVFTKPENNPFFSQSMAILLRHAGKSPPPPASPGLFALGADGVLETLLRDSGFSDVRTRIIRAPLGLPDVSETLQMMQQAFGAYRAVLADLDEARQRAAWAEVAAALKQFEVDGAFRTSFEFIIGGGAKAS